MAWSFFKEKTNLGHQESRKEYLRSFETVSKKLGVKILKNRLTAKKTPIFFFKYKKKG